VSMNFLMAGMLPTMMALRRYVPSADNPLTPNFWFVMSMALLFGFVVAYLINWWLVANHLKHGMMTVRPASAGAAHDHAAQAAESGMSHEGMSVMSHEGSHTNRGDGCGSSALPAGPGDDPAVVPCPRGRRYHRLPAAAAVSAAISRRVAPLFVTSSHVASCAGFRSAPGDRQGVEGASPLR